MAGPGAAQIREVPAPDWLWSRNPPVRFRKSVPDRWIELTISLTISEGRNRQVRCMMAAVGLPTLRLVRVSVGNYDPGNLSPSDGQITLRQRLSSRVRGNLLQPKKNAPRGAFSDQTMTCGQSTEKFCKVTGVVPAVIAVPSFWKQKLLIVAGKPPPAAPVFN